MIASLVFVKATLLIVAALALTRLTRTLSAATRSVCWTALGVALVILPALSAVGPKLALRFPAVASAATMPVSSSRAGVPEATALNVVLLLEWAGTAFQVTWAAGAALLALGFLRGWLRVSGIRRRATIPDTPFVEALGDAMASCGVRRRVGLVVSSELPVPVTGGLFRPYVILPRDAQSWDAERLRAALVHELAHVARWDYAGHLVFEVARALYWPNPLAWRVYARAIADRERAADDRVLASGISAASYARQLLAFATASFAPNRPRAAIGMAPSALKVRIGAILEPRVARGRPSRHATGTIAAIGGGLSVTVASLTVAGPSASPDVQTPALSMIAPAMVTAVERSPHSASPPTVGDPRRDSLLAVLFLDQRLDQRVAAARALRRQETDTVVRALVGSFSDQCYSDRYRAARALRELRDQRAIPDLVRQLLSDDHRAVRAMLANAIAASGTSEGATLLRSAMAAAPATSFDRVARAIDTLGETAAHARLLGALREARRARRSS